MEPYHYIEPELIDRICSISQAISELLSKKESSLFLKETFFNPAHYASVKCILSPLQEIRQNILEAIQHYKLKQSADLKTMNMRNVSLKTVLNLVLVDFSTLLEKSARVSAICLRARKWVLKRETEFKKKLEDQKNQDKEEKKVKEEEKIEEKIQKSKEKATSVESQEKEVFFWNWKEFFKESSRNSEDNTPNKFFLQGVEDLNFLRHFQFAALATNIRIIFNLTLPEDSFIPHLALICFHFALRASKKSDRDAGIELLEKYKEFESARENKILLRALEFVRSMFQSRLAVQNVFKSYRIFNIESELVTSAEIGKDLTNDELENLSHELLQLLEGNFYVMPKNQVFGGLTFSDGTIAIHESFLNPTDESPDESNIATAQVVLLIIHELAHKKRLQHQVQWRYLLSRTPEKYNDINGCCEAGECLESQIFGMPVKEQLLGISTDIAARILDPRSWESLDLLKGIFQILATSSNQEIVKKGFTISPFGEWKCGKKEWNQLLISEEKEIEEDEGIIEIPDAKE